MRDRNSGSEIEELRAQLAQLAEEGRRLTRIAEELHHRITGAPPGPRKTHLRLVKGAVIAALVARLLTHRGALAGAALVAAGTIALTAVPVPFTTTAPPPFRHHHHRAAVVEPRRRRVPVARARPRPKPKPKSPSGLVPSPGPAPAATSAVPVPVPSASAGVTVPPLPQVSPSPSASCDGILVLGVCVPL